MKAGEDTVASALSEVDVSLSKEQRGYLHLQVSFYNAVVEIEPRNIELIPYCIPDSWCHGKTLDFMLSREEFEPENPHMPSVIAIPTPISEVEYQYPLSMLNLPTIQRPDVDPVPANAKWSGSGFYEHCWGTDFTGQIEALHQDRVFYTQSVGFAHVAHKGPRTFMVAQGDGNMVPRDHDGVGPGCSKRENQRGAESVWNGRQSLFPPETPSQYNLLRAQ